MDLDLAGNADFMCEWTTFDRDAPSTEVNLKPIVPELDKFFSPPATINTFEKLVEGLNAVFDYRVSVDLEIQEDLALPTFESLSMCSGATQDIGNELVN